MSETENEDMALIGHMLDDYVEWVQNETDGTVTVDYIEADDIFSVSRNDGPTVAVFSSEIDHQFYLEHQAVFVEAEIGEPDPEMDLSVVMNFSGDELVLSRISLSHRGDEELGDARRVLVVEAALPSSKVEFSLLDLLVREVATIAADLRNQLGFAAPEAEDDDDDDGEETEDDDGDGDEDDDDADDEETDADKDEE